jgi:aminopeptidase YwaD
MFGLIKKVIDEIGPRPPCSDAEKKLGRLLIEEWKPTCDSVDAEPFSCSPAAFVGSYPIGALFYLAAVVVYWFFPPVALALATVNCSLTVEVLLYREYVDFMFPRRQGENVVGTVRPKGEATRRVIISGHMDSAYEFNFFLCFRSASTALMMTALVANLVALGACLARTMSYFNVFSADAALDGAGIAMIALAPVAGLFLVFTSWKPVPDAFDNMSAISVVSGLSKYLGEARQSGGWSPQRTEVVLLATSSEEAGLRGAKRYVRRHMKQMKDLPTYCIVMEMIKDEKFLTVSKSEVFPGARYDPRLVRIAQDAAASRGWPIAALQMPPGWATDGAAFSQAGISATCLSSCDPSRIDPTYHTRYDTYEHIRPESLSVMLQLVIDVIQRIDKN